MIYFFVCHIFISQSTDFFFRLVVASGLNYICTRHWPGESSFIDEECVDKKCAVIDTHICVNPSGKLVSDQGSQTLYLKYELSAKVESMVLRKDVFTTARYRYSNTDHGYHIRLGP